MGKRILERQGVIGLTDNDVFFSLSIFLESVKVPELLKLLKLLPVIQLIDAINSPDFMAEKVFMQVQYFGNIQKAPESKTTSSLDFIAHQCNIKSVCPVGLTGNTPQNKRQSLVYMGTPVAATGGDHYLDTKLVVVYSIDHVLQKRGVLWSRDKPKIPSYFSADFYAKLSALLDLFEEQYTDELFTDIDQSMETNHSETIARIGQGMLSRSSFSQSHMVGFLFFTSVLAYKLQLRKSSSSSAVSPLKIANETTVFINKNMGPAIVRNGGWETWFLSSRPSTPLSSERSDHGHGRPSSPSRVQPQGGEDSPDGAAAAASATQSDPSNSDSSSNQRQPPSWLTAGAIGAGAAILGAFFVSTRK